MALQEGPAILYGLDLPEDMFFLTDETHACIRRNGKGHQRLLSVTTKTAPQ